MFTEEQAKEKWCPFARCAMKGEEDKWYVNGINRWPLAAADHQTGPKCIASECMAWRWKNTLHERGHCGLAGAPDE